MHNREQKLTENCTDGPICITEIKTITKKLKSGKSSGPDLICYEIIAQTIHQRDPFVIHGVKLVPTFKNRNNI
jgi:hypothetical protein